MDQPVYISFKLVSNQNFKLRRKRHMTTENADQMMTNRKQRKYRILNKVLHQYI